MQEDYHKSFENLFFLFLNPISKKCQEQLLRLPNVFRSFFLAFLAFHHLTIFIPSFKDIFEFFEILKLVISDEFRSFGHTFTRKASGLREVVIHTVIHAILIYIKMLMVCRMVYNGGSIFSYLKINFN